MSNIECWNKRLPDKIRNGSIQTYKYSYDRRFTSISKYDHVLLSEKLRQNTRVAIFTNTHRIGITYRNIKILYIVSPEYLRKYEEIFPYTRRIYISLELPTNIHYSTEQLERNTGSTCTITHRIDIPFRIIILNILIPDKLKEILNSSNHHSQDRNLNVEY